MKKYTFTYTKTELLELCVKMLLDRQRRRPFHMAFLAVLFLYCIIVFTPYHFPIELFLFYLVFVLIDIVCVYIMSIKQGHLKEKTIWLEDGMLKSSGNGYAEIPYGQISIIKPGKRLLLLGIVQTKTQVAWYAIPMRVFSDEKEQFQFTQMLRFPIHSSVPEIQEPVTEDFHFSFTMDLDRWVETEKGALEALRAYSPNKAKRIISQFVLYLCVSIFMIVFLNLEGLGSLPIYVTAIIFFFLLIIRSLTTDPEKQIRKNMEKIAVQSNILGRWDVWCNDIGISYSVADKRKVEQPWSDTDWLAETGNAFYFMRKNSRQFIVIPKDCIQNNDLANAWFHYCNDKGFVPVRIKKPTYIPAWVFVILLILSMLSLFGAGVWSAIQRH